MQIKKDDTVAIISGKDRGKTVKVLRVFPKEELLLAEGVNLKKKHVRPRESGKKGQIVEIPAPFPRSNAMLICPACKKAARFGKIRENAKTLRVCKRCKATS